MATINDPKASRRRLFYQITVGPDENGEYWAGDGPMALFTPGQNAEAFVADLADQLSEAICEDLADDGQIDLARTWPPCPFHEHSLDPALVQGQATWRCRDGANKVRIGSFPSSQAMHADASPLPRDT